MTASTEQERAEFEAWAKTMPAMYSQYMRRIGNWYETPFLQAAWEAWQSARRAPVVPNGYRLVSVKLLERAAESLGSFVSDQGWGQADMDAFDDLSALAAAPQPPEAETRRQIWMQACEQAAREEAAPVQLPEPDSYIFQHEETGLTQFVDAQQVQWGFEKNNPRWKRVGSAYTEHQVRQLLVKQQSWQDINYTDPNCREAKMVVVERDSSGKPTVWCDPEIADLVRALNAGGVRTDASCSGHGHLPGTIMLRDGRCIIICDGLEQMRCIISKCFDVDVNGQKREAAPVQLPEPCGRVSVDEDGESEVTWRGGFPPDDRARLYTEQQVRQLLADQGAHHGQ